MIVTTDFLDHWKTLKLAGLLGPTGPMFLLRFWGYCQQRRTDKHNITAKDLASVCRYRGDEKKLWNGLIEAGFAELKGNTLIAHDWKDHNRSLIVSWENGRKGGRKPASNLREPTGSTRTRVEPASNPRKPVGIPQATRVEPASNPLEPTGGDKSRVEKSREEERGTESPPPPLVLSDQDSADPEAVMVVLVEEIYEAYPRKVGRPDALKAIRSAVLRAAKSLAGQKLPPGQELLARTRAFGELARKHDADLAFVPHPSTWFHQDRFLDSAEEWARPMQAHGSASGGQRKTAPPEPPRHKSHDEVMLEESGRWLPMDGGKHWRCKSCSQTLETLLARGHECQAAGGAP